MNSCFFISHCPLREIIQTDTHTLKKNLKKKIEIKNQRKASMMNFGPRNIEATVHCHFFSHSIRCQQPKCYMVYLSIVIIPFLLHETKVALTRTLTLTDHRQLWMSLNNPSRSNPTIETRSQAHLVTCSFRYGIYIQYNRWTNSSFIFCTFQIIKQFLQISQHRASKPLPLSAQFFTLNAWK